MRRFTSCRLRGPDGKTATIPNNVPYKPKSFVALMGGVKDGDL